jgi:hypothetical protein
MLGSFVDWLITYVTNHITNQAICQYFSEKFTKSQSSIGSVSRFAKAFSFSILGAKHRIPTKTQKAQSISSEP